MEAESEGGVFRDNYRGKQKHEMVAVRDIGTIFFLMEGPIDFLHDLAGKMLLAFNPFPL